MKKGELHLLVIWERARYQQDTIIEDLKKQFTILDCYEIEWSAEKVARNFTRFYGVNLPNRSFKEKECGRGKFLLFLLWDENPQYEIRKTSHGIETVNVKMFDSKTKYRSWTMGGHKIHGTNSPEETNHDLTLLLGVNYVDYLNQHRESSIWDGIPKKLKRDLSGTNGWKNLNEFFYVLNNTVTYVVLRGDDNLISNKVNEDHADVDLLVKEWQNAIYIINGEIMEISTPNRPKILVVTEDGGRYIFDLWNSSFAYHSPKWHEEMFSTREKRGSYYRLNLENDFMSLVYHCLYHKKKVASDYLASLHSRFIELGYQNQYVFENYQNPMDLYLQILLLFMEKHGYAFHEVKEDSHCYYNKTIIKIQKGWKYLKGKKELQSIVPYKVENHSWSGYAYFKGTKDNQNIFVKYGGFGDSCNNEFVLTLRAHKVNNNHFLEPLMLLTDVDDKCIVFPWMEGISLEDYIFNASDLQKKDIKHQLIEIYNNLQEADILHRDLRPDNFIVTDGTVKLIDFQFAIDMKIGKELPFMKCKDGARILRALGDSPGCKYKPYAWEDSYSMIQIMKQLDIDVSGVNLQRGRIFYMSIWAYLVYETRKKYLSGKKKIRMWLNR